MDSEKLKQLMFWIWGIFHIFIWSTLTAIFFIFLNSRTPLYVRKKILPIIGFMVLKTDFALKPWVQAGRFEYHKPHNRKNFFRTYLGVLEFKNIKKIAVRVLQMKIWNIPHFQNMFYYVYWIHGSVSGDVSEGQTSEKVYNSAASIAFHIYYANFHYLEDFFSNCKQINILCNANYLCLWYSVCNEDHFTS